MSNVQPIRLKDAVAQMMAKDAKPFQISFFTMAKKLEDFRMVDLPAAVVCRLPQRLKKNRNLINIRPTVRGHDYPVHKRFIVEFNNQPVIP